jgi:hypothetical protein
MAQIQIRQSVAEPLCAKYSRMAGEELAATVKHVDLWLLLEYRGRWEREAISVFPETVRAGINALQSKIPKFRLALIKQTGRRSGPLSVFWAFSREKTRSCIAENSATTKNSRSIPGI